MMHTKFLRSLFMVIPIAVGMAALGGWLAAMPAQAAPTAPIHVGLVLESGSTDGSAFDWMSYQGLLQAESELGVVGTIYTATTPGDYLAPVQACAADGNDLCLGVGFMTMGPLSQTAHIYTQTLFAGLDAEYSQYIPNLRGARFAEDEVGYLAGILAGMMTESDVIGGVGGWPVPAVQRFLNGYQHAAESVNPDVTVIVTYTNSFGDPYLGAQTAADMMAKGADVIFGVAGSTGNGAIITATQSGAWGIGVDSDQWISLFGSGTGPGSERLLSSAMKNFSQVVYLNILDVVNEEFTSGTVIYGLNEKGVGLAPYHETESAVPQAVRSMLVMVTRGRQQGWLTTDGPWVMRYYQLIPGMWKSSGK